MNAGFRRLLALVAVFSIAFVAVSALRIWRSGGDFRSLLPWQNTKSGEFRPEAFTLPDKAPLDPDDVQLLSRLNNEYARLTQAVIPSVVSINTESIRTERLLDVWGRTRIRRYPTQGQGSGVIVSKEGHIVTNHHVISGQEKIQVTLHGGKSYPATLIGEDNLLDIAVLKIQSEETFTPLKFGDSNASQVGQLVFAVGNPFGLGETVTQGIISAKERSISDNQPDLIQTDAAINPGNSGGPLVNLSGEIIGINVAIYSQDRENPGFQGVGFSIPSNDVKDALVQILERGRPVRGYLGIVMHGLDPAVRSELAYSGDGAVAIGRVLPDSPAQSAGLQARDVILSFNSQSIRSATQLVTLAQRSRIGDKVTIKIWRAGATLDVQATIAEAPATPLSSNNPPEPKAEDSPLDTIGISVRDLTAREAIRGFQGIVVTHVRPESAADRKMLPNDLIVAVNQTRVSQANDLLSHLSTSPARPSTTFHVIRSGNNVQIEIESTSPPAER